MNATDLTPPRELVSLARIDLVEIRSNEEYLVAVEQLNARKRARSAVVKFFAEPKKLAHAAWRAIVKREQFFTDPLDSGIKFLGQATSAWLREQERIRREKEAELRRKAEAEAEAERKKLEAQRKRFETLGKEKVSKLYEERANGVQAAEVHVATTVPRPSGATARKVWKAEITDMPAFLAGVATDERFHKFITVATGNPAFVKMVRSLPAEYGTVSGLLVFQDEQIAMR